MSEKVIIFVAKGVGMWLGAIILMKVFNGFGRSKSLVRCSSQVKREIKDIKRYNKRLNDSIE